MRPVNLDLVDRGGQNSCGKRATKTGNDPLPNIICADVGADRAHQDQETQSRERHDKRCNIGLCCIEPAIDDCEESRNASAAHEAEGDAPKYDRPVGPQQVQDLCRQAVS